MSEVINFMQILKTRNYRDVSVISSKFGHTETSSILCNAIADVHKTARNSAGGDKRSGSPYSPHLLKRAKGLVILSGAQTANVGGR